MNLFNKARVYQLSADGLGQDTQSLNELLLHYTSRDPEYQEIENWGFVPPLAPEGELVEELTALGTLQHVPYKPLWLRVRHIKRNLPAAVVKRAVSNRVAEIEEDEDRKVRGREKQEIKEQVLIELLPKAFLVERDIQILIVADYLIIDNVSPSVGDAITYLLRKALGSLKCAPLRTHDDPAQVLTHCVAARRDPGTQLYLGNSFKVNAILEKAVSLSGKNLSLSDQGADVLDGLSEQYHISELGLLLELKPGAGGGVVDFTLTDQLTFKGIGWPEEFIAAAETTLGDEYDQYDALLTNMALVANGLNGLIDYTTSVLGGRRELPVTSEDETDTDEELI